MNWLVACNVMPFGLYNASATFERLMEQMLAGLPTKIALLCVDNILVTAVRLISKSTTSERIPAAEGHKPKLTPK